MSKCDKMNKITSTILIILIIVFISTAVFALTDSNSAIESFKKQQMSKELNNRDFVIFSDPVIFQDFVQFSDSVSMIEVYIQHLFTDIISAEDIEVQTLEVQTLEVSSQAEIEELFVEDLTVGEQTIFEQGIEVGNLNSDFIYTEELETDFAHITDELLVDGDIKVISLAQNSDNEYAYVCLDYEGKIFRSDIPCHDLNANSEVELSFIQLGEIIIIDFQGSEFHIELLDVFNESSSLENTALIRINGDYELISQGDEVNIAGLSLELDNIFFNENEFQNLNIVLHEVIPLTVLSAETLPFEYEFTHIYENLRFNYSENSEIQDIEIIFAESITGDTTLEVNDESAGSVLAGESIVLGNIDMDIISTDFVDDTLTSMIMVVQDIIC